MKNSGLKYRFLIFISQQMIACDEAALLASKALDQKLSFKEFIKLKIHLLSCRICRKYKKDIQILQKYLKNDNLFQICQHHKLNNLQKEKYINLIINELKNI